MSPATVTVRQLIYTNVEADQSPTRQRGLQVWKWSKEFTPEQRKLIASRLEDYRLPPGASPEQGESVHRYVFCRPGKDLNIIARTVPMTDKDKFGRGGKYFAHASILSDDDLERLGCDPFRLIGVFPYWSHPDDANRAGLIPVSGDIPDQVVALEPNHPRAPEPPPRLKRDSILTALSVIEKIEKGGHPLVIPEDSASVLGVVRHLFSLFPPCFRRYCQFDSLSSGQLLQQHGYAVAGGFTEKVLQMWPQRRYVKLAIATEQFTPKQSATPEIHQRIMFDPKWRVLSDSEREQAFLLLRTVAQRKWEELKRQPLSAVVAGLLEDNQDFTSEIKKAVADKIEKEVPFLAQSKAIAKLFSRRTAETLHNLAKPIPVETIDEALLETLSERPTERPSAACLSKLKERVEEAASPLLAWMQIRWKGDWNEFQDLEKFCGGDGDQAVDFRKWMRSSLPAEYGTEHALRSLPDKLQRAPLSQRELRDAYAFLASVYNPDDPDWIEAKLCASLTAGLDQFTGAYDRFSHSPNARGWLFNRTIHALANRWIVAWHDDGNEQRIGLFLAPREADRVIVSRFVMTSDHGSCKQLFLNLWSGSKIHESTPPDLKAEIEPFASKEMQQCCERVVFAEHADRRNATEALKEALKVCDRESFRYVVNSLVMKGRGEWNLVSFDEDSSGNSVWFVGLRMVWSTGYQNVRELFAAVAGSLVQEYTVETRIPTRTAPPRWDDARLCWFFSRLAYPLETGSLYIRR